MPQLARTAAILSLTLVAACASSAPAAGNVGATASGAAGGTGGAGDVGGTDAGGAGVGGAGASGAAGGGGGAGGAQPLPTAPIQDTYKLEAAGSCTRTDMVSLYDSNAHAPGIVGFVPATSGVTYPLFVFAAGTFANYQSTDVLGWLDEMASRGFVAVSVEYENGLPGGCASLNAKALCAYDPTKVDSAMSRLCARADVDCSKGIVTAGHSQGGQMSQLAKNYDMRVRAAWTMGMTCDYVWDQVDGICNPNGTSEETCLVDVNTALPGSRLRVINGDRDDYGDQTQYERVTGKTCDPGVLDCLNADGSGWYRIPSDQVEDYHGDPDPAHTGWGAEHCFWINSIDGQWCPAIDATHPQDKSWLPPANLTWSLSTNLAWLQGYVNTPNVPQKIDAGATESHADFVRDQKLSGGASSTTTASIDVTAANAAPEAVYWTSTHAAPSQPGITYTIDDLGPGATYGVRLHFAEIELAGANLRKFDVRIGGVDVETDLDVFAAAGGANKALVEDYTATADASGVITVELLNGSAGVAMVSGVEIF